jgi:hypothetical protein
VQPRTSTVAHSKRNLVAISGRPFQFGRAFTRLPPYLLHLAWRRSRGTSTLPNANLQELANGLIQPIGDLATPALAQALFLSPPGALDGCTRAVRGQLIHANRFLSGTRPGQQRSEA